MRRRLIFMTVLGTCLWNGACFGDDDPLSDLPPVLPDPSLATSVRLPANLTNAGAAQVGPSLSASPHGARTPCTGANPCAMATPAADHVAPARAK